MAVLGFAVRSLGQMLEQGQLDALLAEHRAQADARPSGDARPARRNEVRRGEGRPAPAARANPFARPARPAAAPSEEESAPGDAAADDQLTSAETDSSESTSSDVTADAAVSSEAVSDEAPSSDPVAAEVAALVAAGHPPPGLATVLVGADPACEFYVGMKQRACKKAGIESFGYTLPADATQEEVEALVKELNDNPLINGILVQLPLPKGLDEERVLNTISIEKDVDGFRDRKNLSFRL